MAGVEACCGIEQHNNHMSEPHTATQRTPEPKVGKQADTSFSFSCWFSSSFFLYHQPLTGGSATDSCQFHVESMDSCRLHIRNFSWRPKFKKTWVEYAGWVQYGAVRCLHGSLNDFLCSCIFIRLRWLL